MVDAATLPKTLLTWIHTHPRIALAYSGGLDSRFLAFCLQKAGADTLLLHITGPHIPARESAFACSWAKTNGFRLTCLPLDLLEDPSSRAALGSRDRCYVCKQRVFSAMRHHLLSQGEDRILCDGSNFDDLSAFRPGRRALKEAGVASPLEIAHLTKDMIRAHAEALGLSLPNQRPSPCLFTRFAYGITPNKDELVRLDRAEAALEDLFSKHTPPLTFRLRITPAPLLQISQFPDALRPHIVEILHDYLPCRVFVTSRISGFFDRELPESSALPLLTP